MKKIKAEFIKKITEMMLVLPALFVCIPIFLIFTGSFFGAGELKEMLAPVFLDTEGIISWKIIPDYPTFQNYHRLLLLSPQFFVLFWNSLKITAMILLGQLLIGVPAAWAFAVYPSRLGKGLFALYVVLMLLPFQVTMLSSYLALNRLGLLNTHMAVILPAVFSTFPIFLTYGGFREIPAELLDAARMDGAGEWKIFMGIGLPLAKGGILSAVVLGFLEYWNMIEQPLVFLSDKALWPLSLYLPEIVWSQAGYAFCASLFTLLPAGFAGFLILMWVFTIVSKAVYVSRLPVVAIANPTKKYVEHQVEADGMVIQGGERAVTAQEGLRVQIIFIHAGDRVEVGKPLFQVDLEDLKEIIQEKETEIARIQYQITDLKANQALDAQKKKLAEERLRADYADTDRQTGTQTARAESARDKAESRLQDHLNTPVNPTSEEDRQRAWDQYNAWTAREEQLLQEITMLETTITNMESPTPEEPDDDSGSGDMSEEEKNQLEEAKGKLQAAREALAAHEKNQLSMPDFSSEDSALESWGAEIRQLEDILESAGYSQDDAYRQRDNALKEADRALEDSLFPEKADSTMTIYELELAALQAQKQKLQEILKQEGIVTAEAEGVVTAVLITVGGRIPGTAALLLTDTDVPCQFKAVLNQEQKKYVKLGDTVNLKLDSNNSTLLTATVDYITESEMNPGIYNVYLDLPQDTGVPGMSGTLQAAVTGELYEYCIPMEALNGENEKYFVYVVKEREGFLGAELYAERVNVQVADQNGRLAAIETGGLNRESRVIVEGAGVIKGGDIVRYSDEPGG